MFLGSVALLKSSIFKIYSGWYNSSDIVLNFEVRISKKKSLYGKLLTYDSANQNAGNYGPGGC